MPLTVLQLELPGTVSQKDLSALFFHTVYLGDSKILNRETNDKEIGAKGE